MIRWNAGARRILLTLQTLGYVEAEARLFRLTPKILDLGFAYLTSMPFWSLADPSIHQATYQFDDEASLDRAMKGEDLKRLVADFNRDWPDVTRTRETFVLAEEFAA